LGATGASSISASADSAAVGFSLRRLLSIARMDNDDAKREAFAVLEMATA